MSSESRGGEDAAQADASSAERLFARELRELREIGFAEGLPLSDGIGASDALRLECGSMGVAVEFGAREDQRRFFRVVSLAPQLHADLPFTSSRWRDIVTVVHSRIRPNDND